MHILVIHHWPTGNQEIVQKIAETFGILVFEAQQRMTGGGPVIIASFADAKAASVAKSRLEQINIPHLLINVDALQNGPAPFPVRHFRFTETGLQVATATGEKTEIPYASITHLLSASSIAIPGEEATTSTERKFSLGKTLLTGGIPMTKKVTVQAEGRPEVRNEILCLYAKDLGSFHFHQSRLNYAGLGDEMKMSSELNFNFLRMSLARAATQAKIDDRLRQRPALAKLLGASFDPDANLELAFEILFRTL